MVYLYIFLCYLTCFIIFYFDQIPEFKAQPTTAQDKSIYLPIKISLSILFPLPNTLGLQSQFTNMPTLSNFYTIQDVSNHKTKDDCWIIVDGKVLTFPPSGSFSFAFCTSLFNCVILDDPMLLSIFCLF